MRRIVGLGLAALLAAGSVEAQQGPDAGMPRRALAGEPCPVELPEWATGAERFAWRQICAGNPADMRYSTGTQDAAGCDARAGGPAWPESRILSARFLKLIAARQPYVDAPARRSILVRCARLDGQLDLAEELLPQALLLLDSRLAAGASLDGARVERNLSLNGSSLGGQGLSAIAAGFDGALFLRGTTLAGANLMAATIAGELVAEGAQVTGVFMGDRLTVDGILTLRQGDLRGGINLLGARIGNNLEVDGTRFGGLFNADGLHVGGSLFLRGGAEFAGVDLRSASIGGSLEADGSRFDGPFTAEGLSSGGYIFLRDGARFTDVSLVGATAGSDLQLRAAEFAGMVDLTGMTMRELQLSSGPRSEPVWGPDASLILRNVQAEALQARMPESWLRSDGSPLPVDLQGFRYARLGGLGSGSDADLGRVVDAAPLIAWVEGSGTGTGTATGHAPQPYFQMEGVLRDMGADRAADQVAYARHLHRMGMNGNDWRGWADWSGDALWRWLVGFGVYPFRILWWVAALIVVGAAVARRSGTLRAAGWMDCFWYSLENTLPLIEPSAGNRDVLHEDRRVRGFFHFQKIAGFVLATILVGTLTLVGA